MAADNLNFHTYYFVITFVCIIFALMDKCCTRTSAGADNEPVHVVVVTVNC